MSKGVIVNENKKIRLFISFEIYHHHHHRTGIVLQSVILSSIIINLYPTNKSIKKERVKREDFKDKPTILVNYLSNICKISVRLGFFCNFSYNLSKIADSYFFREK